MPFTLVSFGPHEIQNRFCRAAAALLCINETFCCFAFLKIFGVSDRFCGGIRTDFQGLAERHNPIVRRIVLRTRPMLEAQGPLKRLGVLRRPEPDDGLPTSMFSGEGLEMSIAFSAAYENAEASSRLYAQRFPAAGFLKTILLRPIGSALQRQRVSQQVKHHAHPPAGVQFPMGGEPDR